MKSLVAVDGSAESERALAYASDVADAMDGSITVVHAVDPSVYDLGGMEPITSLADADDRLVLEDLDDAESRAVTVLQEAVEFAEELGSDVESDRSTAIRNAKFPTTPPRRDSTRSSSATAGAPSASRCSSAASRRPSSSVRACRLPSFADTDYCTGVPTQPRLMRRLRRQ